MLGALLKILKLTWQQFIEQFMTGPRESRSDFMDAADAGWAETEFQRQATAACELHRHVLERHRLRASHEYGLKAEKLWKALADLEELLKAMDQQLEVCQSEGGLDALDDPESRTRDHCRCCPHISIYVYSIYI